MGEIPVSTYCEIPVSVRFKSLQTLFIREEPRLVISIVESIRKVDMSKILTGSFSFRILTRLVTPTGEDISGKQRVLLDVDGAYWKTVYEVGTFRSVFSFFNGIRVLCGFYIVR